MNEWLITGDYHCCSVEFISRPETIHLSRHDGLVHSKFPLLVHHTRTYGICVPSPFVHRPSPIAHCSSMWTHFLRSTHENHKKLWKKISWISESHFATNRSNISIIFFRHSCCLFLRGERGRAREREKLVVPFVVSCLPHHKTRIRHKIHIINLTIRYYSVVIKRLQNKLEYILNKQQINFIYFFVCFLFFFVDHWPVATGHDVRAHKSHIHSVHTAYTLTHIPAS